MRFILHRQKKENKRKKGVEISYTFKELTKDAYLRNLLTIQFVKSKMFILNSIPFNERLFCLMCIKDIAFG